MVSGCYGEWDGERDVLVGAMVVAAMVSGYYGVASVILSTRVSGTMVSCAMVSGCSGEVCDGQLCGEWVALRMGDMEWVQCRVCVMVSGWYGE